MRRDSKTDVAGLAFLAYVPFLLSSPGRVSADSKLALFVDPGGFLGRAGEMWDPSVGAGTVPHQNLGYLFPTGPWFWFFETVGVPDWVAQRLWWGTVTLVALTGARWLFHLTGVNRSGALAGALVYGLSPYQLAFTARISVLLLPWAALPWLVGLTMRASRSRDWRAPALLSLALVLVGGINASSLLLVAIGPAVWLATDAARGGESARRALAAAARIGLLALGVSAWWLVGIRIQGAYGLPVLQLTENVRTVAEASAPGDVLRGLGNWFFYGRDRVGYSLDQAHAYASHPLVVAATYAVPVLALGAAFVIRWPHRLYFALLVVVGVVVAVGSWPPDEPTPYGSLWRTFTSDTSVGLAFRNSPRAVPLVLLGLAGLIAAAVSGLPRPRLQPVAAGAVAVVVLASLAPVARHGWLTEGMSRPEEVPAYWVAAAEALDRGGDETRVLEVPGSSFAAYQWGTTVDPLTPDLIDRPYLAAEVLPSGTPGLVNLLSAIDRRMQQGTFEGSALPALARLLGAGTVSLRADLERRGRFDAPPVEQVWDALRDADGLGEPEGFGPAGGDGTRDELSAVELFDVEDPVAIVRTAPVSGTVLISGDGDGLVDAAAAGLLDGRSLVLQATGLDDAGLAGALAHDAHIVLTDSHRRRIETWFYSLRDTRGPTEVAGEREPDPTGYDFRLEPFPGADDSTRSVVQQIGAEVSASAGGGPERPWERAARALDGDAETAWRVGGPDPRGQSITIRPARPIDTDVVRLRQPSVDPASRRLRTVALSINGEAPVSVDLGPESLTGSGQAVPTSGGPVRELTVEILETAPPSPSVVGPASVGLAEITLGDLVVDETVRLPVELQRRAGAGFAGHSLDVVLTRLRHGGEETRIDRLVTLPEARDFAVVGTASGVQPVEDAGGSEGCRDDLVAVDGRAVAVRLTAGAGRPSFESCEPLALAAGEHRVTALGGRGETATVDRLVLSSGEDGDAAPLGRRGSPSVEAGAEVDAADGGPSVRHLDLESDGEPFWLVLGESHSEGWAVTVEGATVERHAMVDGYANGWLVTPDSAGPLAVTLRWGPQRLVPMGLAVSGATVLVALWLSWRRRRDPNVTGLATRPSWRSTELSLPVHAGRRAVIAPLVVGAGMAMVSPPVVAILSAAAAALLLVAPVSWPVVGGAAILALGISRAEARPSMAWLAVGLLLADALTRRTEREDVTGSAGLSAKE